MFPLWSTVFSHLGRITSTGRPCLSRPLRYIFPDAFSFRITSISLDNICVARRRRGARGGGLYTASL